MFGEIALKVLVAIPALDTCATDFAMSLAALMSRKAYEKRLGKTRDVDLALACCKGSLIMHSRNKLMQQALDCGASHILFLDSDMTFPPDVLDRLIAHRVGIVGADYVNRVAPHALNGTQDMATRVAPLTSRGLLPMLTLPFGCILIDLKTLVGMSRPWFKYLEGEGDHDTQSEDTFYCNSARRLGHTIWCDAALTREVGHIGQEVFRA